MRTLLELLLAIEADGVPMDIDSYPQEGIFCRTTSAIEAHEACTEVELATITIPEGFAVVDAHEREDWLVDCSEGFSYAT